MPDQSVRRSRSRSPARRSPRNSKGFRWKDSRDSYRNRRDDYDRYDTSRRPRDFRDRSPERRRTGDYHCRDDFTRREERPRSPRRSDLDEGRKLKGEDMRKKENEKEGRKEDKEKKVKNLPTAPPQEMIVVNINDRLGTKSAIPCLPSDTIGQLKLMIAARIGREPGQIMLRRQGERPFKGQLSLEDYGISNGVQLDLEVDTGD